MITSGRRGAPPIIGQADPATFADPLPQALALTAIVITFAVTILLLALGYRSWLLTDDDEVEDDLADRAIARGATLRKEIADQETLMSHEDCDAGPP
jgi:multicomponent Na+:H+ antiporter subunit C